ncbi:MAG: glycosyltransferase family 39 protein [Candidatus Aureabacteria bacterium]|nr:glycosyltransferase family 39 protein [Candidatus Auribacterota bacterium]
MAGIALLCYLLPLGTRPLFIPDEYRYAEIPREMLDSGDWVVPRLGGLRYFEKPPLAFWLSGLSLAAFGRNPFAARLPSALSALSCALVLAALVRRMTGERRSAASTALIFLSFFMSGGIAMTNLVDFPFVLFLAAALAAFYYADTERPGGRRTLYLLLCGAAAGAAFLTKGFLAFVLPALVVVPYLLWERRLGDFFYYLPPVLIAALAVILPWAILIHRAEPTFWDYFIITEHLQRFLGASFTQHTEPFWFFLPVLAWALIPWILLAPPAVRGLLRAGNIRRPLRLAISWALFPFLFLSVSEGKLATYVLPCLPAFAILFALGLDRSLSSGKRRWFDAAATVLAALIILIAFSFLFYQFSFPWEAPFGPGEGHKIILIAASFSARAILSYRAAKARSVPAKIAYFALGPLIIFTLIGPAVPRRVVEHRSPRSLLERNAARIEPGSPLYVTVETAAAACWHGRRADDRVFIVDDGGELEFGLSYPEAKPRYLDWPGFTRAVGERGMDGAAAMIVTKGFYRDNADRFPIYDYRDEEGNFLLLLFFPRRKETPEKK